VSDFVSLISFKVHPGREADFIEAFIASGMLSRPREIEGFKSASLLRQRDDPTRFAVTARWDAPDAYAAWQDVSESGAPRSALIKLAECIAETAPGQLYETLSARF
jgi:heme-degrading monooxygenase HmoA